ncbi:long-chain fatty acid--CoA ligase [Staphylococcus capitis]|uniref:AMP-binding protein n=1 Tax=Staphylococcus capitis TaxID=29388 RepID=UPI000E6A0B64|nr:AMP-binding protein [Staphylococcus capitis]RIM38201.1 long-chain fatty acid--CoA ligase [Staphylococcus capitis]
MLEVIKNIYDFGEHQPKRLALVFDHQRITYDELIHEIDKASSQYSMINVGEKVGLLSNHPIKNLIHYFAIHRVGGIPCFFNSKWNKVTINQLIEKYKIQWLKSDQHLIKTGYNRISHSINGTLLHIGFTSGTTGLPKAYYRNEHSWLISYKENEKLIKHDSKVIVAPGPLSHSLSLYACIYALFTGRTFVGQKEFNAEVLVKTIQSIHQPASLFVVPTMLYQFILKGLHTAEIKSIFSSGAKLSKEQFRAIAQLYPDTNLIEFFGTSEASFISYNFNQTAPRQSVGKLFPNVEAKLFEKDSKHIGLLKVRSEMTFSGYVGEEQISNEWIETGDYALIRNRNLYLVGRKSDRLIIGGVNVYPSEIEQRVMNIEGVSEAIVIGEPHHKFGEIAVLLYTGIKELKYSEVKTCLKNHLSRYEVPSKIRKIDGMHYTESGKIARGKLKTKYLNGEI